MRNRNITHLDSLAKENADLIVGVGLYAITAYLDAAYTVHGIHSGLQEGNPIPRLFMDLLGITDGLIFVKGLVGMALLFFCCNVSDIKDRSLRCLPLYIISFAQAAAAAAWHACLQRSFL